MLPMCARRILTRYLPLFLHCLHHFQPQVTQTLWAPTYTTDYPLADKILARKHEHNKFYVDNNA